MNELDFKLDNVYSANFECDDKVQAVYGYLHKI